MAAGRVLAEIQLLAHILHFSQTVSGTWPLRLLRHNDMHGGFMQCEERSKVISVAQVYAQQEASHTLLEDMTWMLCAPGRTLGLSQVYRASSQVMVTDDGHTMSRGHSTL